MKSQSSGLRIGDVVKDKQFDHYGVVIAKHRNGYVSVKMRYYTLKGIASQFELLAGCVEDIIFSEHSYTKKAKLMGLLTASKK